MNHEVWTGETQKFNKAGDRLIDTERVHATFVTRRCFSAQVESGNRLHDSDRFKPSGLESDRVG